MEIKYFGIHSDLVDIIDKKTLNKNTLIVFDNYFSILEMKKKKLEEEKFSFDSKNNFLDIESFYEKLFVNNKIMLKEEKEVILFYNSLTKDTKKKLGVKSYFDIIDLAYNHYKLFHELKEYKINKEAIEFEKWQINIFNNLENIQKNIEKKLEEKSLTLKYILRDMKNINYDFLKKYNKIIFINKLKFTPFEKELLREIEKVVEINIFLQLDKNNFNENTFKLEKIEFPDKLKSEITVVEYENKFQQIIGLVNHIKNESNTKIYDGELNNESDYKLLNQNKIVYIRNIAFSETKVYLILKLLEEILQNIEINKNGLLFKMDSLLQALKSKEFIHFFGIERIQNIFDDLLEKEYKYLSINQLHRIKKDENAKYYDIFILFLEKIEKIYSFQTLEEYEKFLIELVKDNSDSNYYLVKAVYLEALSELLAIERFDFDGLWNSFFRNNISMNLLKLFLKYLDKKNIDIPIKKIEESDTIYIDKYANISEMNKENIYFFNLQENFPKVDINNFLLTPVQRSKLGLPIYEEEKLINSFHFYKNILSAKHVKLSYIRNLDEKIDSSSLISELILKYDIKVEKSNISEDSELELIKDYFLDKEKDEVFKLREFKKSKLIKKENLEDLTLGYYQYNILSICQYRYFLDNLSIKRKREKIKYIFDARTFGNIIHKIFEEIIFLKKTSIEEDKNFEISRKEIEKIVNRVLEENLYKISNDYIEFYKTVSFENLMNSVETFLEKLKDELKSKDNIYIKLEEKIKQKKAVKIDDRVSINGVVDLHIVVDNEEILIDYKSGNTKSNDKKVEGLKQLDYYAIVLYGNNKDNLVKWVIDAWSGKDISEHLSTKEKRSVELSKSDIQSVINSYFDDKSYSLTENKANCRNCDYIDVCRRGDEVE